LVLKTKGITEEVWVIEARDDIMHISWQDNWKCYNEMGWLELPTRVQWHYQMDRIERINEMKNEG
jgi:hypothetical protein